MKNKLFVAIAAVALVFAAGVGSLSSAFAQEGGDTTFVQKLAQKLGVSEDKVKIAVDEIHTERHAQMQVRLEDRLTEAVANGELTEAQKEAILAKVAELHANREAEMEQLQNMSPEERRTAMEAKRTELQTWADQNGIDPKYLPVLKVKVGGPGHFKAMGMDKVMYRGAPAVSATPAQ